MNAIKKNEIMLVSNHLNKLLSEFGASIQIVVDYNEFMQTRPIVIPSTKITLFGTSDNVKKAKSLINNKPWDFKINDKNYTIVIKFK